MLQSSIYATYLAYNYGNNQKKYEDTLIEALSAPQCFINLSGAKLRNLNLTTKERVLKIRFKNANLQRAYFINSKLKDVDFQGADLEAASFSGARAERVSFKLAVLISTNLNFAILVEVDFTEAHFINSTSNPKQLKKQLDTLNTNIANYQQNNLLYDSITSDFLEAVNQYPNNKKLLETGLKHQLFGPQFPFYLWKTKAYGQKKIKQTLAEL